MKSSPEPPAANWLKDDTNFDESDDPNRQRQTPAQYSDPWVKFNQPLFFATLSWQFLSTQGCAEDDIVHPSDQPCTKHLYDGRVLAQSADDHDYDNGSVGLLRRCLLVPPVLLWDTLETSVQDDSYELWVSVQR